MTVLGKKPHRLASQYKKFGSIRILRDGRVRFSAWTVPGHPALDFLANYWRLPEKGSPVYNATNYSISVNWHGQPIFFLHLARRRVESAGFALNLTPTELREAVTLLCDAGNGIEQWITPGLAHMQVNLAGLKSDPNREAVTAVIPALLKSVRAIPIAEPWEPLRREWAQWRRRQRSA